ncbi:MAG: hypothetical protein ACO3P1_10805 [Pseudomonadales bacterium]
MSLIIKLSLCGLALFLGLATPAAARANSAAEGTTAAVENATARPAPTAGPDAAAVAREALGIDTRTSYQGTRVVESSEADRTVTLKEFRAPGRARIELVERGQTIVMLLDEPAGKAYLMLPDFRLYGRVSMETYRERAWDALDLVQHELDGTETVQGHPTTRYRITWTDPDGRRGHGLHWVTNDGVPIKMDIQYDGGQRSERVVAELRDLKVAPIDSALFELPKGFTEIPGVEAMLGGEGDPKEARDALVREGLKGLLRQ